MPRIKPEKFQLSREQTARNFRARAQQTRRAAEVVSDAKARQTLLQRAERLEALANDPDAVWRIEERDVARTGLQGRPRILGPRR